jgi:DNA polymerase-4
MAALGIRTIGDLRKLPQEQLTNIFGKQGSWYYSISRGIDPRTVNPQRIQKSLGKETTLHEDTTSLPLMKEKLIQISQKVSQGLLNSNASGRTITLKITYGDFEKVTRSRTLAQAVCDPATLEETAVGLLSETEAGERPIRLLGISVSKLDNEDKTKTAIFEGPQQLELPFSSSEY